MVMARLLFLVVLLLQLMHLQLGEELLTLVLSIAKVRNSKDVLFGSLWNVVEIVKLSVDIIDVDVGLTERVNWSFNFLDLYLISIINEIPTADLQDVICHFLSIFTALIGQFVHWTVFEELLLLRF